MAPVPVAPHPISHLNHQYGPPSQASDLHSHLGTPTLNLSLTEPSISPLLPHGNIFLSREFSGSQALHILKGQPH